MGGLSERLRPAQRMRAPRDFLAARQDGRSRECGFFLLQVRCGPTGPGLGRRIGVIASKRLGNAPERNLAKRRLRELFRRHQEALPENCDVVLVARRPLLAADFAEVRARYLKTLGRLLSESRGVA